MEIISRAEAKALGLSKYYTGKECSKGHVDERYVSTWQCATCLKIHCKTWQSSHRERLNEWKKEWRAANPEKEYEMGRRNYLKNKERAHAHARNRSAKKRMAGGSHTAKDIARIFKDQNGKCVNCLCDLHSYHVDHIMPLALGGSNGPENLQCLCPPCNMRKSDMHPDDWEILNGRIP